MVGRRMKEELVEAFGEIFSGGRYSEDAYISCVTMAAGMGNTYLENIRIPGLPNADSAHRKIKAVGRWENLRLYYKRYVKARMEKLVKEYEYYVIIDETPWAYYGSNFNDNIYLWG